MTGPVVDRTRPFAGAVVESPAAGGADWRALAARAWVDRRRLALGALVGAALAAALSFALPPVYVAGVALLEAPKAGGGSALDQLGVQAEMLGLKGGGSNALTFPDILRSRRLLVTLLESRYTDQHGRAVTLIDHLRKGPASPQRTELAVKDMRERLDIGLDRRTNLLRVGVKDRDPVLAAAVANRLCTALQDVLTRTMMTQASANRRFIEERLASAERELGAAESALRAFREANARIEGSPRLLLDQARLLRELRTREEVVIALTRQYEIARVDENRDVPVLNVMDPATVPAFRSAPRRVPMTLAGALLGLALTAGWPLLRRKGAASGAASAAREGVAKAA